jgi:hypothetical protein
MMPVGGMSSQDNEVMKRMMQNKQFLDRLAAMQPIPPFANSILQAAIHN